MSQNKKGMRGQLLDLAIIGRGTRSELAYAIQKLHVQLVDGPKPIPLEEIEGAEFNDCTLRVERLCPAQREPKDGHDMAHYVLKLTFMCDGYEFSQTTLQSVLNVDPNRTDIQELLQKDAVKVAGMQYEGGELEADEQTYSYYNGQIRVEVFSVTQITWEEYKQLKKYI